MKILLTLSLCCVSAVVVAASAAAVVRVSGHVGAEVSIRCSGNWTTPANSSERHKLYFCRGACTEQGVIIQSTGGEAGVTRRGRYSVEAGGGDGAFKVTIAELEKTDAGTYRCGVRKSMAALYQEVSLVILDASTVPVPGSSPPHAATPQAGAGSLPESSHPTATSPSPLSPSTSQENSSPPAAGKLKETTVVIIVSVSLALVVCAVIPLIFYGHCRSGSAQSKVGTNNPEAGCCEHNADAASAPAATALQSEDTKESMSQPAAVYRALDPKSLD